ncbi:metalloregulator ArsR/SmtB family transcription factor [Janibacter melonis]|uniref:ArsR/SmtB family transcription factor n=1 Tax=Janibacter melonis TaxID=262209 RepID=UPI002E27CAEF|nr:metalloregulator ArsR/SmtB family transcription factor [Janibacter melonis]
MTIVIAHRPPEQRDAGHGVDERASKTRLDLATAKSVASTLQALATPSRLLILATLQDGPKSVGQLVSAVQMEQPAVSHQLRLLRTMGLVESERHGRNVVYSLFDDHVSELIDQAIYHAEHLRLDPKDDPSAT